MYVCGITAYDRCHIGHARSAVVFDVVYRYLEERGFKVQFVRNFTDIDDKIINRSREEGIDPSTLAQREIRHFYEDMDALGVRRPTCEPRATEHIPEIISLVERLIEKGHAYEADGDVYFRVRSFADYGGLSGRNVDELRAGARIKVGVAKEDPLDFALWKKARPGEPRWDSPWGAGRPGWHIECSAMSMKYLGETLDIHGGGLDLIFPHHENERAQSEAATGRTFVRYWLHNGFVTIKGEKMSKSLGNFVTISKILEEFHPEALRLFLLSKHYRSPLDYSPEILRENEAALSRCYYSLKEAIDVIEGPTKKKRPIGESALAALDEIRGLKEAFYQAMDDDFNTARAIGYMFEAFRSLNSVVKEAQRRPSALFKDPLREVMDILAGMGSVLGILQEDPASFLKRRNLIYLERIGLTRQYVEDAINRRAEARRKKDWSTADAIRNELNEKGIILMDTPHGTEWQVSF